MSEPLLSAPSANFMGRMAERSQQQEPGAVGTVSPSAAPQPGEEERQRPAADGRGRAAPGDAETGGGVGGAGGGGGKKRHRRRPSKKKRRWKPYFKLSWEEKKKLDERESVRAAKTRAEMFAKGFTVAPYNTTQFLMEEHNQEEPDLNTGGGPGGGGGGGGGPGVCPRRAAKADESSEEEEEADEEEQQDSGSDGMGGDGGGEFLRRDFSETYERYHAESLQNMTKQELIREYLELEKCLSRLEDENNRLRGRPDGVRAAAARGADPAASESRLSELEREMERLRAQNLQLLKENELYKPGRGPSESAD
ncbi:protein HEXIM1-like [Scyliorhinus canicula]|uniref:protein HEXIM1-like n=1 Tax=Scyliorhinus canicula TaxID=7830 RepID=UPI0018F2BF85|nr:protein HEXIM1-like [Scyliorhinus canicula]